MNRIDLALLGFLCLLMLGIALCARAEKKPTKIPVMITIRKIDQGTVYFQPMVAPMFYGSMEGESKEKIGKCYATEEPVAELKDGGVATNLVLHCGTARIVVRGVDFE